MADFREELHISRSKDQFGKPVWFTQYDYCHTKTDLADNTVKIVSFGERIALGEACKLIDDICSDTEFGRKLHLKAFLESDKFDYSDEY